LHRVKWTQPKVDFEHLRESAAGSSETARTVLFPAAFQPSIEDFDDLKKNVDRFATGRTLALAALFFMGLAVIVPSAVFAGASGTWAVTGIMNTGRSAPSPTFKGTAAPFTVVSGSAITTTVPAGATTGAVQVVTPRGTLSSNVPFTVN
jgi:hypothetical protein